MRRPTSSQAYSIGSSLISVPATVDTVPAEPIYLDGLMAQVIAPRSS